MTRDDSLIIPLPGQSRMINAIMNLTDIGYFFFIAGYGSGKSYCIVILLLMLIKKYEDYSIKILLGGTTLGDVKKFILDDFFKILILNNIDYRHDKKLNEVYVGRTLICCVPTEDPTRIYGHSVDIAIIDEIDELKKEIAMEVFKSVVERTRTKRLPDRDPFMAFFTTTQGKKRGIHSKLRDLRDSKIPHCVVRASTIENHYNSSTYVKNLEAIYTEDEKKAFLHGHIVDLSSGQVYSDFNIEKHVIEPFEVYPTDVIHVGQDKNVGYNKAVCKIKRGNILYTINCFSVGAIQDVPRIIRTTYPLNPIKWYPDSSALEILGGYAQEITRYGIELIVSKFNPSIISRIFIVNKLYKTGRSFVFNNCKELINAQDERIFDNQGKPEKPGGEKCPSHICDADEYVTWALAFMSPDFSDITTLASKIKG